MNEARLQTDPIAQLFLSRNAHFEKHRLYDLKTQLSLLPQFGHSKIRSSIPSSSGDMAPSSLASSILDNPVVRLFAELTLFQASRCPPVTGGSGFDSQPSAPD